MTELVEQVDVAAPAQASWALLTDWNRQREWMVGTDVRVTDGDGVSTGSRLVAVTGVGGLGFTDPMEITLWDPPRRCEVRHTGRLVRGSGVFEVRARGAGDSTVVWRERLDLPFGTAGELAWPLVRPAFRFGLRRSLTRLAALVEGAAR